MATTIDQDHILTMIESTKIKISALISIMKEAKHITQNSLIYSEKAIGWLNRVEEAIKKNTIVVQGSTQDALEIIDTLHKGFMAMHEQTTQALQGEITPRIKAEIGVVVDLSALYAETTKVLKYSSMPLDDLYNDRVEEKRYRYEKFAKKASKEADVIPFRQSILTDYYSEKGDRAYITTEYGSMENEIKEKDERKEYKVKFLNIDSSLVSHFELEVNGVKETFMQRDLVKAAKDGKDNYALYFKKEGAISKILTHNTQPVYFSVSDRIKEWVRGKAEEMINAPVKVEKWEWCEGGDSHKLLLYPETEQWNRELVETVKVLKENYPKLRGQMIRDSKEIELKNGIYTDHWYEIPNKRIVELKDKLKKELAVTKEKQQQPLDNIFMKAKETGERQVLSQSVDQCDGTDEECSLDRVTTYALPDGKTQVIRNHLY
jgi:hypothetical protein